MEPLGASHFHGLDAGPSSFCPQVLSKMSILAAGNIRDGNEAIATGIGERAGMGRRYDVRCGAFEVLKTPRCWREKTGHLEALCLSVLNPTQFLRRLRAGCNQPIPTNNLVRYTCKVSFACHLLARSVNWLS